MYLRIFLILGLCALPFLAYAGYIGEDLGTDIYRRVDQGHFALKKQMIEQRLKGSGEKVNRRIGMVCKKKDGSPDYCLKEWVDFTVSELDDLSKGQPGAIFTHLKDEYRKELTSDQVLSLVEKVRGFYQDVRAEVEFSQKKLQQVGSIGLYNDGNIDNSSYDIMYDIEKIHEIIFNHDLSYNGTTNMGAESVANMLAGLYDGDPQDFPDTQDYTPTDPLLSGSGRVNIYTGASNTGTTGNGSGAAYCPPSTTGLPTNLDAATIDATVRQQQETGKNDGSSYSLTDNGYLPEYWARLAGAGGGWSLGGKGLFDKFPCSASDIFCITIQFEMYDQNALIGGKAYTIESILDENLKIVNRYAGSSLAQSKMSHGFFECDVCRNIDLPSMLHIKTVVSRLPPPILNLSQDGAGASETERKRKDEQRQILANTFQAVGLNYQRQNSIESDQLEQGVANLKGLGTDMVPEKTSVGGPVSDRYATVKESDLRNRYDESFSDDLLQLHDFSIAFTKRLDMVISLINALHDIPYGQ